jgi:2-hydroxychromene-2-carboxylate isomerase
MKTAHWYFDVISPFAFLQLQRLSEFEGKLAITPVPVLFGAILNHFGQLGPAEIPGKRDFTYRFVRWQAERAGTPMRFPDAHPFNPLAALRLIIAAGTTWPAIQAVFAHIWRDGKSADVAALSALAPVLGINDIQAVIDNPSVKATLKANTEQAIHAGIFGLPCMHVEQQLFWGADATDYLHYFLNQPEQYFSAEAERLRNLPTLLERKRPAL